MTVWLVDDDGSVLRSLSRLLAQAGYRVLGCESAEAFFRAHDPGPPGCVIVDLQLPGMDGLGLQESLAAKAPGREVLFLSGHGDISTSVNAMKAGAVDFLTKPVDAAKLLSAVELALERDLAGRKVQDSRADIAKRLAALTSREREVLELVIRGRLNKQIAFELGVVEKTVKVHRARVMRKMKVRTLAELVRVVTIYRERGGKPATWATRGTKGQLP